MSNSDLRNDDVLSRLAAMDTCAVSDALDRLDLPGVVHGVSCQIEGRHRISGYVKTVKVRPRTDDEPRAHLGTGAIMSSGTGDVIVVDSDGRTDVSSWGGLLSLAASQRGIEGVVVDGACRDVVEASDLGFPIFARAAVPTSARGRSVEVAHGEVIAFGGLDVAPGDLVIADGNGLAFIGAARANEVLDVAASIMQKEQAMADAVRQGNSIVDVMHDSAFGNVGKQKP